MEGSETELEVATLNALSPFIGKDPDQIEFLLGEHLNSQSKSYFRTLAEHMLESTPDVYLSLMEHDISIRAVRVRKNSVPKESMSLPVFKFDDIVKQTWDSSDLRRQLDATFLFLVFELTDDGSGFFFRNASFWKMPECDKEKVSFVWGDTQRKVMDGQYDSFIPKSANLIAHVRPHAKSSSDTYIYKGTECKKYSFWLNNDYIGDVIARFSQLAVHVDEKPKPTNLEEAITQCLSERGEPMMSLKLRMSINPTLLEAEDYNEVINSMIQRHIVERIPSGLRLKKYKLEEMLDGAPAIVSDYFLMEKDQFRQKYSDGEKVFLILRSFFSTRPDEDSYGPEFSKYRFSPKLFKDLYGVDDTVYRYLDLMYTRGWTDPEELLNDPHKTDTFKRKLRANLQNTVEIGEMSIYVDNESIITYVVSRYSKPKNMVEISRLCKEFIDKNGLQNAPLCKMNTMDIREYADMEHTRLLRVDSKRVRYYPHDEKEVLQFLRDLNLERYRDMYVAAQLLINDSEELCRSMDIVDESDMFMLLNKYKASPPMKESQAVLSSSPSICFGTATVGGQIEALLQETGRIEKNEFGRLYSERYGMKEQSLRAYMAKYPQYSNGNYYDMNLPEFPDYVVEYLRSQFRDTIISTDVARKIFANAEAKFKLESTSFDAKNENDPYFNAENLKNLGYKWGQGSIFVDRYPSIRDCVEAEYLQKDELRLDDGLKDNVSFMRIFDDYLDLGRYYPIDEDQYYSYHKLEEAKVTKDIMSDYVDCLLSRLGEDEYFTLEYLRKTGFEHPLEDYGFEDVFYENILMRSDVLRYGDIAKHKVFTNSKKFIRNEAIVNITLKILGNEDSDYVDLLSDKIHFTYNLNLLSELKKEHKPLKYCKYTEKIYRDDDTYISEIKGIQ